MNPFIVPTSLTTASVNTAIASLAGAGGTVWLPPGVLDISDGPIVGAGNIALRGTRGATIIRVPWHTVFNAYSVNALGCDDFHIADITFDMGDIDPPDDNWPTTASGAVLLGSNGTGGGKNCSVTNCEIINAGRYGIVARGGTRNLYIALNDIERTAPAGAGNVGIMLRGDGTANYFAEISGNTTSNICGLGASIYQGKVIGNTMRGSGFGANMELEGDANCTKNIVAHNNCSGSVALAPDFGANGIEGWASDTLYDSNITDDNIGGSGLVVARRDCTVSNHRSANNTGPGVYVDGTAGGSAHNTFLTGCKTRGNTVPYKIDPSIVGTVFGVNDFR